MSFWKRISDVLGSKHPHDAQKLASVPAENRPSAGTTGDEGSPSTPLEMEKPLKRMFEKTLFVPGLVMGPHAINEDGTITAREGESMELVVSTIGTERFVPCFSSWDLAETAGFAESPAMELSPEDLIHLVPDGIGLALDSGTDNAVFLPSSVIEELRLQEGIPDEVGETNLVRIGMPAQGMEMLEGFGRVIALHYPTVQRQFIALATGPSDFTPQLFFLLEFSPALTNGEFSELHQELAPLLAGMAEEGQELKILQMRDQDIFWQAAEQGVIRPFYSRE